MKYSKTSILFALFLSQQVLALGLGGIESHSYLNQPLDAEVELVGAKPEELASIKARLAPQAVFDRSGIQRPFSLTDLRFTIATNRAGRPVIKITSKNLIREPYLDFIVELNWPGGNLLREYTLLMDPPTFQARPEPAAPSESAAAPAVADRPIDTYGPVKPNETLWVIANKLKPDDGVTTHQMMQALLKQNPKAFIRNNINLLKAGAVLEVPDRTQVVGTSPQAARTASSEQTQAWQRQAAAEQKEPAEPSKEPEPSPPAQTAEEGEPYLSLVVDNKGQRGETQVRTGSEDGTQTSALAQELHLWTEQTESLQQESKRLTERVNSLQAQLSAMQQLIALKDNQLAALQKMQAATEVEQDGARDVVETPPPPSPPKTQTGSTSSNPQSTQGGSDADILRNLVISALVLSLLLALWLVVRRRRQPAPAEEEVVPPLGEHQVEHLPPMESMIRSSKQHEQVFMPPLPPAKPGEVDMDGIDLNPVTDANIHMAYGEYGQTEALLKKAIEKQPESSELRFLLLQLYFTTNNRQAFEREAEILRPLLPGEYDPHWIEVMEMSRKLSATGPSFTGEKDEPTAIDSAELDELEIPSSLDRDKEDGL